MKKLLLLLFLLSIIAGAEAQKSELGFSTCYSTYSMTSLKALFENSGQDLPFDAKIVSEFPPWFSFGGYYKYRLKIGYSFGFEYNYNSTGARISSADYSGKYFFDQRLNCHSFGFTNSMELFKNKGFEADLALSLGMIYSKINFEESLEVFDTSVMHNSMSLKSHSFYFQPGIILSYSYSFMKFGITAGYLFDLEGAVESTNGQKTDYTTNWSGLRIGPVLAIYPDLIFRKEKKPE